MVGFSTNLVDVLPPPLSPARAEGRGRSDPCRWLGGRYFRLLLSRKRWVVEGGRRRWSSPPVVVLWMLDLRDRWKAIGKDRTVMRSRMVRWVLLFAILCFGFGNGL